MNQNQFRQYTEKRGYSWCSLAVLLASALAVTGCDDKNTDEGASSTANNVQTTQSNKTETKATSASQNGEKSSVTTKINNQTALTSQEKRNELATRYAAKDVTVLDASELQRDGASTMVVTFSVPLDPDQKFDDVIRLVDTKKGKLEGAWELSDNLMELRFRHLPPSTELNLTIDKTIKGINDRTLVTPFSQKLTTEEIFPSVGFTSKGSLLPLESAEGLSITALNVDQVDVNFFRVKDDKLAQFLTQWENRSNINYWESDEFLSQADLVYTGRFELNTEKNTRENVLLPLKSIDALKKEGAYIAVMQQAGKYSYTMPATVFTFSDIGISVHSYLNNIDIFTQSLNNGAALNKVELRLLDEKGGLISKALTDNQGHASLEKNDKARLLMAIRDGQTSMIDLRKPALDLSEFDIGGPQGYSKQFFVFGPRDLYRPGEILIVNALLRDGDGNPIKEQPVKVDLLKTDGQISQSFVWQPENGLYQLKLSIPENESTGTRTLRFDIGDGTPRFYEFQVEDFMPERMALDITGKKGILLSGNNAYFDIKGRYLYGAPASDNRLQGQIFLKSSREAVSKLPGYEFGDVKDESFNRLLDEFELNLDADGETTLSVDNERYAELKSPVNIILQASLLEAGGRPVTRRYQQAVWPATHLAGIRPLFVKKEVYDYRADKYKAGYSVDDNSMAEFDIVYTDQDGNKLPANDLNVKLIYERHDYYWRWSNSNGWESGYNQKDLQMDEQTIKIAKEGTAKVAFPVEWGSYRIEVSDPKTNLVSSLRFWAGYSWMDNTNGTGAVRPDQVKLSLDKKGYLPGDKVKLNVIAPHPGKGYVLLESSNGPLWWQEVDMPEKGLDIEVPINKEWARHDLYLTTVVVRPGDASKQATVKRAVGILHLPLQDKNRRIDIALDAPEKIRPNQDLKIRIKAKPNEGESLPEKINVLVSAVDTGVLNITDYKTPNPYDAFFGRKRYSVDQYDVYGQLIEGQGRLANLRFGGDGGEEAALSRGGKKPLTEVQIIAQQSAPVILNAQGEGEVSLPIPEFNGEVRLMAQAWTADKFGSQEGKVVIAAPLVTQLSLPRFMAGGDSALLSLDLTNLTDDPQAITLNYTVSGLVGLNGAESKTVSLNKGERTQVQIPVKAKYGFGQGEFSLSITGIKVPNEEIKPYHNTWKIGVRPAYPAETVHYANTLKDGETWRLPSETLNQFNNATLEGELLLTSRPPLQVARYVRELFAYPYGCLEQTVSGLYPSLYSTEKELKQLGIKTQTDADRKVAIEKGIAHLLTMQKTEGGFSLWDQGGSEEYWLTAYATDFLFRASQQGYAVPADALKRANDRLLRYLQDKNLVNYEYAVNQDAARFSARAYAALVLANQQKAPLGELRRLYLERNQSGSGLALVQLGIALKLMGDNSRAEGLIAEGVTTTRKYNYGLGDYGSVIRDQALIIALLSENNLDSQSRDASVMTLSDNLTGREWFSTQESNSLYLAGRFFINMAEQPWEVVVNRQVPPINSDRAVNETLTATQLQEGLELNNRGGTTIYSRMNIVGYPKTIPAPYSNVLNVNRSYYDLKGRRVNPSRLQSGEMLVVKLEVSADRDVPDALVVDLLPAGLEIENQNLASSSASLSDSATDLQEFIDDMGHANIKHLEYRDDRFVAAVSIDRYRPTTLLYLARAVTPGSYQVPPPQVESMYVPYWRAIGMTEPKIDVVP
ncbi:alpha-2-macroglobulin family protein [Proteus myxofaciens]|uniref:Alpha-2-macroglobulin n=1 Tax=Proteus myxofaciens ATCC 19692 TaxID=1354337 RepID=A0A198GED6_9GAMM|nr:alpha-2-macroglobulin [Proteus myxofaciens]OAT35159.1 alpha-2-macroglobulin [Proteus myxofaciens ATCC 19692]